MDSQKTTYQQVVEEIEARSNTSGTKTSLGVRPSAHGGSLKGDATEAAIRNLSQRVSDLYTHISEVVENRIISGLDITAKTPISRYITVAKGKGVANGLINEIVRDTDLYIPQDDNTQVWYINLYDNALSVDTKKYNHILCIGKIIIPKPGVTAVIQDDREKGSWNGYIVSGKDFLFAEDYEIDEQSLDAIRDSMRKIFAENIFGTITLSERLTVVNREGSMSLSATDLKFFYPDGGLGSKFNKRGTYFYDDDEKELAVFTADYARVGNIKIYPTYLQIGTSASHIKIDAANDRIYSANFVSGWLGAGWQIDKNGDAEFNNAFVRGRIATSVFEKNSISTVGGNLLVMEAAVLDSELTDISGGSATFTLKGETVFAVGDMLRIKDGVDDEWLEVTALSSANVYTVTRDKKGTYGGSYPAWKEGTAVTNFGASGEGGIYMTSSESNAPYISVVTHAGAPWTTLTTPIRLGNLNGFLGYSTDKYGIAIGESTKYLKYDVTNGLRVAGHTLLGSLEISTSGYIASGQSAYNTGTGFWMEYNGGTPRMSIGNSTGNNRVTWDGSTLTVRGTLNADDLVAGTIDAGSVTISSDDGKMTLASNVLTIKDGSDVDQVILGKYDGSNYGLSAAAGEIIINEDGITVQDAGGPTSSRIYLVNGSSIFSYFTAAPTQFSKIYCTDGGGGEIHLNLMAVDTIICRGTALLPYTDEMIFGSFTLSKRWEGHFSHVLVNRNEDNTYAAIFNNDGNHVNRYGIKIRAGRDDGTGTNHFLRAFDGDNDETGRLSTIGGVFQLVDVSSEKVKQHIRPTKTIGRDIIKKLEVCDFEFIKAPEIKQTGFVAERMKTVLPQIVSKPEDGFWGVSKEGVVPYLVLAYQEMEKDYEAMEKDSKSEVDKLKKEINMLKKRLT